MWGFLKMNISCVGKQESGAVNINLNRSSPSSEREAPICIIHPLKQDLQRWTPPLALHRE